MEKRYPHHISTEGWQSTDQKVEALLTELWSRGEVGQSAAISVHLHMLAIKQLSDTVLATKPLSPLGDQGFFAGVNAQVSALTGAATASTALSKSISEASGELMRQMTRATESSTQIARHLAWATWALVSATIGLLIATIMG